MFNSPPLIAPSSDQAYKPCSITPRALMNPTCAVRAYEELGLWIAPPRAVHQTFKALIVGGAALTLAGACALASLQAVRLAPLVSMGAGLTLLATRAFQWQRTEPSTCLREKAIAFLKQAKRQPLQRVVIPTLLTAAMVNRSR